MDFVPEFIPSSRKGKVTWWFVFRGDELLTKLEEKKAVIPCARNLESLNLEPLREQYLGRLDGLLCYSAELTLGAVAPEGMVFRGLRELYSFLGEKLFRVSGYAFQIMNWDRTHQYCAKCGVATEHKSNERAKICPQCDFTSFPSLSPAIIVAVVKDNRILLARAHRFPGDLHSVIAGFVEPGETLEECLTREVREEVGIQVKNIKYFGSQSWSFPHSLMVAFTADYAGGRITVDESEVVDAGWFQAEDLPRIPDTVSISRRLIDWFVETHH